MGASGAPVDAIDPTAPAAPTPAADGAASSDPAPTAPTAKPTLAHVAKASGVALSTVSSILSGRASCYASAATRKRVFECAEQLGYRPPVAARALVGLPTATVGVLVPGLDVEITSRMLNALEITARTQRHMIILAVSEDSPVYEDQLVQWLIDRSVDAVIAYTTETGEHTELRKLVERDFPVLTIDGRGRLNFKTHDISIDYDTAGRLQARHLIQRGKTRVALADSRQPCHVIRRRVDGLNQTLIEAGLAPATPMGMDVIGHTAADGPRPCHELIKAFLRKHPGRYDAIVAISDLIGLSAMRACQELGLRVPEDVAIVGFEGSRASSCAPIPLTTVAHPAEETGRLIFETTLRLIQARPHPIAMEQRLIAPQLVVRAST